MIAAPHQHSDLIQTVTGTTFTSLITQGHGPIAVEFMSYGCAHCRSLEPIIQQAAEMLGSKEQIFRVNVAVEQDVASAYAIQGTPTIVMFLAGREVGRVEGPQPTLAAMMTALTEPFAA